MEYGLIGKFTTLPGKRDELKDILLEAAQLLESNEDCIHYIVSISDSPNTIWVSEVWSSKEAHDVSLKPAEIQALIKKGMPLISTMPVQTKLQVVGGKGL